MCSGCAHKTFLRRLTDIYNVQKMSEIRIKEVCLLATVQLDFDNKVT